MNQIIRESMLHLVGQAQYVERVLHGFVGVDPVCILKERLQGRTGINIDCSETKHLVRTKSHEVYGRH